MRFAARAMKQSGFSMVEVLVALVVLGVGMLGIASLYVVTLRSGGSAISRMQAVNLASDLADRIRANRNGVDAYENAAAAADHDCIGEGSSDCTPTEMAQEDLLVWQDQVATTLPGNAQGTVEVTPGLPRTITIRVTWNEPGEDEALTYDLRMQL